MKIRVFNYTFNASDQQVTFTDTVYVQSGIALNSILLITNVNSNIIIYNFSDSTAGGTVSGNVLTLTYNTTSMNNTDPLLIYYDDTNINAEDASLQILSNQENLLRRLVKLTEAGGTVDSSNRQRITIDAAPASLTIGTVTPTITTTLASTVVSANYTGQEGNSYPSSTNPYILTSTAVFPTSEFPVSQEWRIINDVRNAFANGIRKNII